MSIHRFVLSAAALLCCCGLSSIVSAPARAGDAPVAAATEAVRLPQSRQWTMSATGSGREYRIFVAEPDGPVPEGGYTTIYVLDANGMFFTTVEAVRAYARRRDESGDRRAIVIGIGYPEGVDVSAARTFDLTPAVEEGRSRHPTGGADAFLDFIERDLKPRIAREYPVDPRRQALMGHSFSGMFVLGAMTRRPEAFQTWVGMSSSFWFGHHDLVHRIAAFAKARPADAPPLRVLLTVGEFEQRPRPQDWARDPERAAKSIRDLEARGQVTRAREAAKLLAQAPGVLTDFREIPGEDHGTVIPAAVGRGVDFVFNGPQAIPPVPSAAEYMRLGPEGRYRLRMEVRGLPDPHRIPWLNALKRTLEEGLDKEAHLQLHEERQRMDERYGSRPHEVNAD